jgi:hypothetical protein
MLAMIRESLEMIKRKQLEELRDRLKKIKQIINREFTKADLDKLVASIERSNSWFIMIDMDDRVKLISKYTLV